jgi:hypothetical protein
MSEKMPLKISHTIASPIAVSKGPRA